MLATFDAVTRNQTRDLSLVGCGTFSMSSVIVEREREVTWFVHVPTALENLVVTGKTKHFIIADHHPARNPPLKDSGDTHRSIPPNIVWTT